ncbi:hypothetical protein ABZT03_22465 [Streptomyces sp. NPDC005574]|uniref:hypothetical protein n=1 Tax=Streptomyces sp. NPDC005574 TaxID=3156891 RepID=UPI0033B8E8AC
MVVDPLIELLDVNKGYREPQVPRDVGDGEVTAVAGSRRPWRSGHPGRLSGGRWRRGPVGRVLEPGVPEPRVLEPGVPETRVPEPGRLLPGGPAPALCPEAVGEVPGGSRRPARGGMVEVAVTRTTGRAR